MKRNYTMVLVVVLSVAMLIAGCGKEVPENDPQLLGRWKCTLDMTQQVNAYFEALQSQMEPVHAQSFQLDVYIEFLEDESYRCWVDGDQLDSEIDGLIETMSESVFAYMEQLILEQNGTAWTIDEILEAEGLSKTALVQELFPDDTIQTMKDEIQEAYGRTGRYAAAEGKLYTSAGPEYDVDAQVFCVYSVEKESLTMDHFFGADGENTMAETPMTFHRCA